MLVEGQCSFFKTGKSIWRGNKDKLVICIYLYIYVLLLPLNISPPKMLLEKYRPVGFFGVLRYQLFSRTLSNRSKSQKLVHENVYPIKLKIRLFSVDGIFFMLALHDVISNINLRFRSVGQLMNTYRL